MGYHGVSAALIFDSTSIRLCGPVSTTTDRFVAIGTFGRNGVVVEIQGLLSSNAFFDCPFWSDFTDEDEKLFIGGLQEFTFRTIRDIPNKKNYAVFVQAMAMFQKSIDSAGWNAKHCKITPKHHSALKLLTEEETAGKVINGEESTVPQYILRLWHHMLAQISTVEIYWYVFTEDDLLHGMLGYKRLCPLFCNDDVGALDFTAFVKMMPNLKSISLFHKDYGVYAPSISLNAATIANVMETLDIIG